MPHYGKTSDFIDAAMNNTIQNENKIPTFESFLFSKEHVRPEVLEPMARLIKEKHLSMRALVGMVAAEYRRNADARDGFARLGLLAARQGELRQALRFMRVDDRLGRSTWWHKNRLAETLARCGRWERALEMASRIAAEHPEATNVFSALALVHDEKGRKQEALHYYDLDYRAGRMTPGCMVNRAVVLGALDRKEESLAALKEALQSAPSLLRAFYRLGDAWARNGHQAAVADMYLRDYLPLLGQAYAADGRLSNLYIDLGLALLRIAPERKTDWTNLLLKELSAGRTSGEGLDRAFRCALAQKCPCLMAAYGERLLPASTVAGMNPAQIACQMLGIVMGQESAALSWDDRAACIRLARQYVASTTETAPFSTETRGWLLESLDLLLASIGPNERLSKRWKSILQDQEVLSMMSRNLPETLLAADGSPLPGQLPRQERMMIPASIHACRQLHEAIQSVVALFPRVGADDLFAAVEASARIQARMRGRHCGDLADKMAQYASILEQIRRKSGSVNCLEIGTLFGGSCLLKLMAMREQNHHGHIVCIDPFCGFYGADDPQTGVPVTQDTVLENLTRFGFDASQAELRPFYSTDPRAWNGLNSGQYAHLMIDGDHSYEGVIADWMRFSDYVAPGGFVLFDDYQSVWTEVTKAVDYIQKKMFSEWHLVGQMGTTVIVEKK